jgi:cytochrome c peroxidase
MSTKLSALFLASTLFCTLAMAEDINKWLRPKEVPQPKDNLLTQERIELGKLLYFDVRISANDSISCATCHHPKEGWTDLKSTPKAIGFEGRVGPRNSPAILNAAYQKHQFWDGRVKTLEEQAVGPVQADVEMNMPMDVLIPKLQNIKGYIALFDRAYPGEGITQNTFAKAIASFERTIVSTESPFDKYITGDTNAINQETKDGFSLFKDKAHCIDCHDGWNFSDGSFQNIGLNKGELKGKELGRYNVKNRAAWYGVFKTPTLRDVTKSAPYFHDGSAETLEEATRICASGGRHENGVRNLSDSMKDRHLTQEEIHRLVIFMHSLTGPDIKLTIPTQFPQ